MLKAQILHAIPGRIRVRISQVKDNSAFAKQLEQALARMQMVQWFQINPLTGSVLIGYDPGRLPTIRELQAGNVPTGKAAEELLSLARVLGLIAEDADLASLVAWIQRQVNGAAWTMRAVDWWQRVLKP
jgi:heavy-metal-associated domain-containing protein